MLKHLNPDLKLICLAVYLLNEHRAMSNDCTMYNTFLFLTVLNLYIYTFFFFIPCLYYYFNVCFTSFYVKHFELPLCMKCAI